MKEKITQFARGNFSNAKANIKLSEEAISIKTEEGRSYKSSFLISNDAGIPMKGILYSECSYLKLSHRQFEGISVLVEYEFLPEILTVGEKISDVVYIISNCGEISLPFTAEIMTPTVQVPALYGHTGGYIYNDVVHGTKSGRKISDLNEFSELAKENPKAAIEVFCREDFVPVFLHGDIKKEILYNTLIKGPLPVQAMEEFLININKKNRVVISASRHNITYTGCDRNIYDGITIRKNTWGYQAVKITSDSPYIIPEHKILHTDRWNGDETVLKFWIDTSVLKDGTNTGTICLDTINRHIEIVINCEVHRDKKHSAVKPVYLWAKFLRIYVDYVVGAIDRYAFFAGADDIVVECRRYELDGLLTIISAFKGIAFGEKPENCSETEKLLEKFDEACLIYFRMNTSDKDDSTRTVFKRLCNLLVKGNNSPLIYYEYCKLVKNNPEYIHEWSEFAVRPLAWGIRHNMFDAEMAMAYTYHVSKMKQYNKVILCSLKTLYEKFGNKDTLEAICGILIRNAVISKDAAVWYERGIECRLRITQIYEYYMISLPDEGRDSLLPQVVMYFAYDNNLAEREKAILYAFIIKDKDNNPTAYSTYQDKIREFAFEQLELGHINKHLAVIYADAIKKHEINEELAGLFAKVMFINEISCMNSKMKEVCVVTDELADEMITPITNGRAYINICADNQTIYLIDEQGNRYLSDDYTINSLIRYDGYPEKCFEFNKTDELLLTYMYTKCLKEYQIDEEIIEIRRAAANGIKLRDYYNRRNISALTSYYYNHADGDGLDTILADIGLADADKKNRNKWIEMFIVRGMYDKAMEAIESYGFYELNLDRLSKFCDDVISDIGLDTENEILVRTSYHIFNNGRYSDNIIKYLTAHYIGPFDNMLKIFRTAHGFEINTGALTERILILSVFTETTFDEYPQVLASYFEYDWDKDVVRAFACHMSYLYITKNQEIDDLLWYWIRDNMIPMQNTCCVLAMLKKLSGEEKTDIKAQEFIIKWLPNMVEKGIIMSFFAKFIGKVPVPAGVSGMAIMEHIDKPGKNIKIGFCIDNNIPVLNDTKEVFYGIYVKELAIFAGEQIVYEFYEEQGSDKKVLSRGAAYYEDNNSADVTRVRMINDMIKCRQENDIDGLYDRMESYIRQKQASRHLFKML